MKEIERIQFELKDKEVKLKQQFESLIADKEDVQVASQDEIQALERRCNLLDQEKKKIQAELRDSKREKRIIEEKIRDKDGEISILQEKYEDTINKLQLDLKD